MSQSQSNGFARSALACGTILQSRYRVIRQLGRGGMGAVYEATDLRLGHSVAVKQTLTEQEELWTLFEREARLMARLNHPVLPQVTDYFTEGNRAFLVMQFVAGNDLAEVLTQQPGPIPRRVVIAWADQLLDALIYLHSHDRQVIHRDIKPHNLKLAETGRIVLLDFGLAKSERTKDEDPQSGRSIFGYSPRYAPLEQIQDLGTTPQSDIYALGATLYHLLTGTKPPDALARAAAVIASQPDPLRPAHEINPAVGEELSLILARAMAQNPNERYGSAVEFREMLRCLGRSDDVNERVEFVGHSAPIEAEVVPVVDTTLVAAVQKREFSRAGARALAAVLLILFAAFGVFCRYYPWKMPAVSEDVKASAGSSLTIVKTQDPIESIRKPRATKGKLSGVRMPKKGIAGSPAGAGASD